MKQLALIILTILLGLMLYTTVQGQDDPLPTTVEVKEDSYVVTDKAVYERMDRLETLLIEANAKLDAMMDEAEPVPTTSINLNTASYDDLLTVPGIGPVKAGSIVAERGQNGEFSSWADLMQRVSGVGPATIADMQAGGAVLE